MGRRNANSTKGRNGGRKFDGHQWEKPLDIEAVRYMINADSKMFKKVLDKHS